MPELKQYLQDHYQISGKDWDLIKDNFETTLLKKGEYFIRKGRVCHRMGFIADGVMRYTILKEKDMEVTCFFLWENDVAGDPDSFFERKPSELNLQAITDCRLTTFSVQQFFQISGLYSRFAEIHNKIGKEIMLKLLDQKTFLVANDASSRYAYFVEHYPHLLQRVPLGYIASFLDITQQSLSRLRKQIS